MVSELLAPELVASRRHERRVAEQVAFQVSALYGISRESIYMPLNPTEGIESGQICVTIDPEAAPSCNIGVADFLKGSLSVCYGVQLVFPGLYELIMNGRHDPSLLNPVRATATDDCTLTPDLSGWRALGCFDILPGSMWSGADGGWDGRITSSLGASLTDMKEGQAIQVAYDTEFLINWPAHLGGGQLTIELYGTMVLNPLIATA